MRDSAGPGGASLLSEDTLAVELRAGPPAQLAVEGPGSLEVGTKASLPQLRVRVCDAAGNPTTSETFEVCGLGGAGLGRAGPAGHSAAAGSAGRGGAMGACMPAALPGPTSRTAAIPWSAAPAPPAPRHLRPPHHPPPAMQVSLNSSALATDGSGRAAAVSASGGNKVKAKKGAAVFRDVRVQADEAGAYALRVQSASRKVAVADAVLHLVMQVRRGWRAGSRGSGGS